LLQGAADEEEESGDEHPLVLGLGYGGRLRRGGGLCDEAQGSPSEREDEEGGEGVADAVEEVDAADLPGDALGYEGGAPDDGDEEEGDIGF